VNPNAPPLSTILDALRIGGLRILVILVVAAIALRASRLLIHGIFQALLDREATEGTAQELSAVEVKKRMDTLDELGSHVVRFFVVVIAGIMVLGALDLNVGPAIAGLGVVGIAVGFGAQTLVKDLFSGACFLIEDVFRIGDYIEAGSAKGTVEKITFRTVALRHQNGPLHFVPYGLLGSVRNNSRDWVIDKFEIPLPIHVSSERIRKMVKKIGEEMMTDPELAKVIMMPLKAKLYRIQPGAKIFRCKVQTPPNKQFEVRTEAYRRIEAALVEAGIPYADTTPQVTVNNTIPGFADAPPARAAE
jgi:small-conductance mechanosensitive channel